MDAPSPSALRHELRTPLNQIIGYSEMLLEDARELEAGDRLHDSSLAGELERIHAQAYELVALIQKLLPPSEGTGEMPRLDQVRQGLAAPILNLHTSACLLANRPEAFLQPFARHISTAAWDLNRFADRGELPPRDRPDTGQLEELTGGAGAKLLVADDSDRNREMLARQLERQGYSVTAVQNGKEALRLLGERPFDLVLLDVLMPQMDGFEALEAIKADARLRDLPVIMISASDEYRSVIRCIESGAEDYLPKPFDPVLLRARLKASLEKKILRDQQRQRTEELERAYQNLKRMQDQLITQQKLASLGSLAAGIAHEIKNPLNFITNFAALSGELIEELQTALTSQDDTAEILEALTSNVRRIQEHGQRADRIVRGMLSHARNRSGDREVVDLNAMVSECANLAYHGLRSRNLGFNVTIENEFDPVAGKANVFPQDLSRAILNIASNAFQAVEHKRQECGPEYHPLVRFVTRSLDGMVEIRVRDNGPGMAPAVRNRIFEPFFTTKDAGQGTGLGLSITHDVVVNEHLGRLLVESEEGLFTEFTISIPREAA